MKIPKAKGFEKRPTFHNLALKRPIWQPCFILSQLKSNNQRVKNGDKELNCLLLRNVRSKERVILTTSQVLLSCKHGSATIWIVAFWKSPVELETTGSTRTALGLQLSQSLWIK
ncbi:hypothetical protein AVEN_69025-1 [Araneus ventricosus]|uniref:Uncharacterized protein n=1 Tax=Araneus ventricosus TaxID=182803 RepID=A0A4Y2UGB5_ARAVE|nr:hypothetical protein AVEN_11201-1 [Araneus ventricosus]GBO11624.1 hypothetical protein AVEN_69025-1 [Araneus ventricosus]